MNRSKLVINHQYKVYIYNICIFIHIHCCRHKFTSLRMHHTDQNISQYMGVSEFLLLTSPCGSIIERGKAVCTSFSGGCAFVAVTIYHMALNVGPKWNA